MMKFNNKNVNKMYIGDTLVNRINDGDFQYMAKHDYSQDYLTIESLDDNNNISWHTSYTGASKTISASTDDGVTWTEYTSTSGTGTTIATLGTGEKVLLKGTNAQYSINTSVYNNFLINGKFIIYGNIMSLIYGDNFVGQTTLTESYTFMRLFYGCSNLTSAENLILPATTLATSCYYTMFGYCTSLTTAPELPATTLVTNCYLYMFDRCTNLEYIKCLATDISATNCTKNWLNGVAASGTFVKAASMNDWTTGISGIPDGWTIENE